MTPLHYRLGYGVICLVLLFTFLVVLMGCSSGYSEDSTPIPMREKLNLIGAVDCVAAVRQIDCTFPTAGPAGTPLPTATPSNTATPQPTATLVPTATPQPLKMSYYEVASDVVITGDTLGHDITGLSHPVVANKTYVYKVWMEYQSTATTNGIGIGTFFGGTGPIPVINRNCWEVQTIVTAYSTDALALGCNQNLGLGITTGSVSNANVDLYIRGEGVIRVSSAGGDTVFKVAAQTELSAQTITISARSWMIVWEVN